MQSGAVHASVRLFDNNLCVGVAESLESIRMPHTAEVDEAELHRLEQDGGLAPASLKDRDRYYQLFEAYFEKEADGVPMAEMLDTEEGRLKFGKIHSR